MKYRKKPVVIEAVQFLDTEEAIDELCDFGLDPVRIDYADLSNPLLKIETLEGLMIATEGDYIIKGVQGYFCRNLRRSRGVKICLSGIGYQSPLGGWYSFGYLF